MVAATLISTRAWAPLIAGGCPRYVAAVRELGGAPSRTDAARPRCARRRRTALGPRFECVVAPLGWQEHGECLSNSGYMLTACPTSCKAKAAFDTCSKWVELGRCKDAKEFMSKASSRRLEPPQPSRAPPQGAAALLRPTRRRR